MTRFKRGDVREDGMVFWVKRATCKDGNYWITQQQYLEFNQNERNRHNKQISSKEGHLKKNLCSIKRRAKVKGLPYNLDFDYALSIAPDVCPVFGIPLGWARRTGGNSEQDCPSLDRIVPELGYTKGNVRWISNLANAMKNNATPEQLKQFANWILNNGQPH